MSQTAESPQPQHSPSSEHELQGEIERLRARLAALESELVEIQSAANDAVGHWQERAYWLERWHLDLNRAMRRPGALQLLGALRAVRWVWWRSKRLKRRLLGP
jgi:hypothetical protein